MESLLGYAPDTWRFDERIDETTTDSRDGETIAANGIHFAGLSDGHRLAENGLPSNAQGRSAGRGRTDLDRVREESGVQSPVAHGSGEVRDVPRPPVRRVHIPKAGSATETRPIGIPTLEDKVLQRAVVMLLEPIYEQDFDAGSYGFRPGRSAHQALEELWKQTMDSSGGWILEVDIRKFFDTLDHAHLREFLRHRMRDGVLKRLIGKWLKAGVMESGNVSYPDAGSPQGGVISPLLANVFLHYVLDTWFRQEVQPRLQGRAHLIRYADDFVILFTHEADARRVMEVLPKRFGKYGLAIHPDKTRLVAFRRPSCKTDDTQGDDNGRPGTFDLLGFTHYWGRTRRGGWAVIRKTASKRLSRAVRSIAEWCRANRHHPIIEQHAKLIQKVRGHYAYYGITGNARALHWFLWAVSRAWRKWLNRRDRCRVMLWSRFTRLLKRYPLPWPKIVHSYVK